MLASIRDVHPGARIVAVVLTLLLVGGAVLPAGATKPHERDGWMAGLSFGVSWGEWTTGGENPIDKRVESGYSPQLRLGHAIGKRFVLGLEYNGWLIESGDVDEKLRTSLQTLTLAFTYFPGNPRNYWGGLYLKAGAGLGWGREAVVDVGPEHDELDHGDSITETGLGVLLGVGYEFRVFTSFAVGIGANLNSLEIGGEVFDSGAFFPAILTLTLYW